MQAHEIRPGDFFVCRAKRKDNKLFTKASILFEMSREVHCGVFFYEGLVLKCADMRIKGPQSDISGYVEECAKTRIESLKSNYSGVYIMITYAVVIINN